MTDGSSLPIKPTDAASWGRIAVSVEDSIDIAAEKKVVFRLMNEGPHPADVVEHRDIVRAQGGGHSCTLVYRVRSQLVTQRNTLVEYVPDERVVYRMASPIGRYVQTCELEALSDGTRLSYRVDVLRADKRFFGRRLVERNLRRQVEHRLSEVKRLAEVARGGA